MQTQMQTLWRRHKKLRDIIGQIEVALITATGTEKAALETELAERQRELREVEAKMDSHHEGDVIEKRGESATSTSFPHTSISYDFQATNLRLTRVEDAIVNIEKSISSIRVDVASISATQNNTIRVLWAAIIVMGVFVTATFLAMTNLAIRILSYGP